MRKLLYIFILASLFGMAQSAKQIAATEFFYVYGGKNIDEIRDIKELPDKNYLLAGTTGSFGQGNTSGYLIRTDSMGKHLWSFPYGGSQNDWIYSMEVTADSGYFCAGFSNSFNPPNGYDAWYFRTDKNGVQLWQKTVSGYDWDFVYGSTLMPDGGFVLCGETYTNSNGGSDAFLVRLDKNGDTLWTRHFGGAKDEKFNEVCFHNNCIYAVGNSNSFAADSCGDGLIVRYDTNGNVVNTRYLTGSFHRKFEFKGITPYDNGSFMVCGQMDWVDSSSTQSLVGRIDTAMNDLFGPYAGGPITAGEYVSFNKVVKTSYGNIYTVGTASGGNGGLNLFIVGFRGDLLFINDFAHNSGKNYDEYGYSGIYTGSGKVIVVGSADAICSTNPGLGLQDAFLVRFNSDSITNSGVVSTITNCFADTLFFWPVSQQTYDKDVRLSFYPNPVNDIAQLEINYDQQETLSLKVFSVLGTEILQTKVQPNQKNELDLSTLESGSYFLQIQDTKGQNLSVLKFIKSL